MTKKEKKELARQIKSAIEAGKKKNDQPISIEEKQAANNRRRQALQKARSRKGDPLSGSKHKTPKSNHLDFETW